MMVLVDTHVWLWMLTAPERLSRRARDVVEDQANDVLVSAASAWEIAIKHALGKLPLPAEPAVYVPGRMAASGCTPLPVDHSHALAAGALPPHHADPFDRLLIAQAQSLSIPLMTADSALHAYDVERIDI